MTAHESIGPIDITLLELSGDPIIEQLKQLAELSDQGILTNEEFQAQKARILAQ